MTGLPTVTQDDDRQSRNGTVLDGVAVVEAFLHAVSLLRLGKTAGHDRSARRDGPVVIVDCGAILDRAYSHRVLRRHGMAP